MEGLIGGHSLLLLIELVAIRFMTPNPERTVQYTPHPQISHLRDLGRIARTKHPSSNFSKSKHSTQLRDYPPLSLSA